MAQTLRKLAPEMLIPRLGEHLVAKAIIKESDLQTALAFQQEQITLGKQLLLGQALVELRLIDRETLDQAITEQILQLRSALESTNRNLERRVEERTAELEEALQRLSELSQLKANFISSISHELRTPLAHMKGYLELLTGGSLGSLSDEQTHAVDVSHRAAARLEALIEDLIMFALASRGELSMKLEQVELQPIVDTSAKKAEQKAEERGVKVRVTVEENLPQVQADAEKIGWVLSELLDNGIKFTAEGGQVVVGAKTEGTNLVTLSVIDTGIGIAANRIKELFEPFHQLDGTSTRRYGGTGLGLSLVRQIVEAHGSLLEVQSVEGKVTMFKFPLLALQDAS